MNKESVKKDSVPSLWDLHRKMEVSSETNYAHVEKSKGADPATVIVGCETKDLAGGTQGSRPTSYFLDKLPPEVRVMIYEHLLMKQDDVQIAHEWLATYRSVNKLNRKFHVPGLHAMILRTCHTVYREGLLMLYGRNRFWFGDPDDLFAFTYGGLKKSPSRDVKFGLKCEPYGWLALVRNVYLSLGIFGRDFYSPWVEIIYSNKDLVMPIGFPGLQRLTLDFWNRTTPGDINVRFPQTLFSSQPVDNRANSCRWCRSSRYSANLVAWKCLKWRVWLMRKACSNFGMASSSKAVFSFVRQTSVMQKSKANRIYQT